MKVVMAWSHGADVPALRAAYPGIEIVEVERASLVDVIGDADVVYGGGLTGAELRAAHRLKWIHSPGAGVEWVHACDGLADSGVTVTNTRGAPHAGSALGTGHCRNLVLGQRAYAASLPVDRISRRGNRLYEASGE